MGQLSFKCALSGIEIATPSGLAEAQAPHWLNDIVVFARGFAIQGTYDGYGRVEYHDPPQPAFDPDETGTFDFYEDALKNGASDGVHPLPKVILARFFKDQSEDEIPLSLPGEWQGWFYPKEYLFAVEALAEAYENHGVKVPTRNWEETEEEEALIDAM